MPTTLSCVDNVHTLGCITPESMEPSWRDPAAICTHYGEEPTAFNSKIAAIYGDESHAARVESDVEVTKVPTGFEMGCDPELEDVGEICTALWKTAAMNYCANGKIPGKTYPLCPHGANTLCTAW